MIIDPTNLTYFFQIYHYFGSSSSNKNYTSTIQTVIAALRIRQNIICKLCEKIGHKADTFIICVHNLLPSSLSRNMNTFN